MPSADGVLVRPRQDADLPACVEALVPVHALDGYPIMAEHVSAEWLRLGDDAAAWVAVLDGTVCGHVGVVPGFGNEAVVTAAGRPREEILGVTRLFVAPQARGHGAAHTLLDAVDAYADSHGLAVALDVIEKDTAAIALYERRGWQVVARGPADWFGPDGIHPPARYYVRPAAPV